jgi:methionine-rich copper-binding protein CopC
MRPALVGGLLCGINVACAPSPIGAPQLIATWPAAGTTVASISPGLELTFNRSLNGSTAIHVLREQDGRVLATELSIREDRPNRVVARLDEEATAGEYRVEWHAVDARGLTARDGSYAFSVRPQIGLSPRARAVSRLRGQW